MKLKKNSSEKKLTGSYYTPRELATEIVKRISFDGVSTILEPSCGDGVFLESLISEKKPFQALDAVEIVKSEADKVGQKYGSERIRVYNMDFFDYYSEIRGQKQYDLILGNPPYIRYQYLEEKQRKQLSNTISSHGMKPNKLINVWVAFLVACIDLLNDNGIIAFVIPAEILQVAYAEDLRVYLTNHLKRITILTFKQLVFPEIEQEVVVFIGEKQGAEGIRIVEVNDIDELRQIAISDIDFLPMNKSDEKWTQYFLNAYETDILSKIKNDDRFRKFNTYGLINVGVTTGNNKYFSVTKDIAKEYDLESISIPLIGRSSHAHGIYFTYDDFLFNLNGCKRALLVNYPDLPYEQYSTKQKEYIALGEEAGENLGYKCSIRDNWYQIPSIWIPDAFFLRRNNLYPKFVLNKCNAISTDTMHRIQFDKNVVPEDVLLSYYNSISFAFTELCGRSYGGGVLEILPGEVGNIFLPDVSKIDLSKKQSALGVIDNIVRQNQNIEDALDLVDQLLVNELKIPEEWVAIARIVWLKLQSRRLGRG